MRTLTKKAHLDKISTGNIYVLVVDENITLLTGVDVVKENKKKKGGFESYKYWFFRDMDSTDALISDLYDSLHEALLTVIGMKETMLLEFETEREFYYWASGFIFGRDINQIKF